MLKMILLGLILQTPNCSEISSVRQDFHEISSKKDLYNFIDKIDDLDCGIIPPFSASATMMTAKYQFLPTTKLKRFNDGKHQLEAYILEHPDDLEARYLRLLVQFNAPDFLGYNSHIEEDLTFVNEHLASTELPESYKALIQKTIKNLHE